jgi:ketosteroid isomerase-like protein
MEETKMRSLFRRLSAAGLPLFLALSSSAAQGPQAENRIREVERLERELVDAIGRTDLATYDRIVADDYVAFEASGKETAKAEILSSYRSGARRYSGLEIFDVRARVFGDTAVVRARTKGFRREADRDVPNRVGYIRVYARREGRWRAVAQMSAPLPEPPPENGKGGPAAPGLSPATTPTRPGSGD